MGLEQGGNPRTVEPSEALHPTPPERGYPGLITSKREFFSLVTRLIVPGAVAGVALAATHRRAEADGGQPLVSPDYLDNYIAGGEALNDPRQFSDRVFPHPLTGSAILVSPDVFNSLGTPSLNQLAQRVKSSQWNPFLNWASYFESAVLAINGAYGFKANSGGQVNTYLLDNPQGTRISIPGYAVGRLQPKWGESTDGQSGLVLTDGYIASYDYQPESNQWVERDEYDPLGTPLARVVKNLRASVNEFNLNSAGAEVDQFAQTGDDGGLTSFQVIRKPNGEPVFFAVTSGPFALDSQLGNLQALPEATTRLSTMTWRGKNLLDLMTLRWGLKSVSAGQDPGLLTAISMRGENTAATFDTRTGLVILNEINAFGRALYGMSRLLELMNTLIVESRHIDRLRHSPDDINSLDPNSGVDKGMVLEEVANENRTKLSNLESDQMASLGRFVADAYRINPP